MKIIALGNVLAKSKRFLISFSLSPTNFETKSLDDTHKKVRSLQSVEHAFAMKVLPVPGGP
jgi:hypothetical protein